MGSEAVKEPSDVVTLETRGYDWASDQRPMDTLEQRLVLTGYGPTPSTAVVTLKRFNRAQRLRRSARGAGVAWVAALGSVFNDGVAWLGSLSPVELVALAAVVFVGLLVLRRAF